MQMARSFGIQIKQMRTDQQITQAQLAEHAKLDRTYISMLERGLRIPNLETVIRIADALGVTAADMVRGIEKMGDSYA